VKARKWILACAGVWLVLGLIALAATDLGSEVAELLVILPAVPFYLLSSTTGGGEHGGLLWDSAHGPPFLTTAGIVVVYFLPALFAFGWGLRRRTSSDYPAGP
jgi:hypothetical protein